MNVAAPSAPTPTTFLPAVGKHFSAKARRDLALIARILDHRDERAYTELMDLYQKSVYFLLLKMVHQSDVAEDLMLEVFVRAFRALPTYRPEFAFSTWLFRVATNHGIAYLQHQRLRTVSLHAPQFEGEDKTFDFPDAEPTPQDAVIQAQRLEQLHLAVDRLPAKYQRLLQLHYFDELSYEEIAERLHLPLGTVKGQLHRGRSLLQHLLAGALETF